MVVGKTERKVLVAYASAFGSTAEVAQVIGAAFSSSSIHVDVREISGIDTVEEYHWIIIGSAIQYDKWLKEANQFVEDFKGSLKKRPVVFFFTCLTLSKNSSKALRQAQSYADALEIKFLPVRPLEIGQFAGVLDYYKIPVLLRPVARLLFLFLGVKEGDYRDWDKIIDWANTLKIKLLSAKGR